MKLIRFAAAILAAGLVMPVAALAGTICPSFVGDPVVGVTGCNTIITVSLGLATFSYPDLAHPYDGVDDNLVGVINNEDVVIRGIVLSGTGIFAFDGDGIDTFGIPGNVFDAAYGNTGYGGPDAYFPYAAPNGGLVGFVPNGIAPGATAYFSTELPPGLGQGAGAVIVVTPEPSSLILLGTGVVGIAVSLRRRLRQ